MVILSSAYISQTIGFRKICIKNFIINFISGLISVSHMTAITPLSAAIRFFVFKAANRFWQRLISISRRVFRILCLHILIVLASHPPSYTLAFHPPSYTLAFHPPSWLSEFPKTSRLGEVEESGELEGLIHGV